MRLADVRLCNPEHLLPMPDRGGRLFSVAGERVDVENAFWLGLIGQGVIEEVKSAPAESQAEPAEQVPTVKARRGRSRR